MANATDVPTVPTTERPAPPGAAAPAPPPSPLAAVTAQLLALRHQAVGLVVSIDATLAQVDGIAHGVAAAQAARTARPAPGAMPVTFGHEAPRTTSPEEHDHGHQGHQHDGADAAHVERIIERVPRGDGHGGRTGERVTGNGE